MKESDRFPSIFRQRQFERGDTPERPKVYNVYCEGHGELGNVAQDLVNSLVRDHRAELNCYFPIKVGVKSKPVI